MTNILVQTDFSTASHIYAKQAIEQCEGNCSIVLFHMFDLPINTFDLLGARSPQRMLQTDAYRQHCRQLKTTFGTKLKSIQVQCVRGNSLALLRNFLYAHEIDMVYKPEVCVFEKPHPLSLDASSLLEKCGLPFLTMAPRMKEPTPASLKRFELGTA